MVLLADLPKINCMCTLNYLYIAAFWNKTYLPSHWAAFSQIQNNFRHVIFNISVGQIFLVICESNIIVAVLSVFLSINELGPVGNVHWPAIAYKGKKY